MIKSIFIDYTGTIIQEKGDDLEKIVLRIWKNSNFKNPEEITASWWNQLKMMEEKSFGDTFLTEDEIVDHLLRTFEEEAGLVDDFSELHKLFQRFWMYAPIFEDVEEFFEKCPLPIYVITNNGVCYVQECLKHNCLKAAGIISGELARAYKPHKELFEYALKVCGCNAEEVIHIGDSIASDVKGALTAGITPILIDRSGTSKCPECRVVNKLTEVLELLV
ncbi:HAD family hydrolase [Lachnospiraceae bacterium 50-23]